MVLIVSGSRSRAIQSPHWYQPVFQKLKEINLFSNLYLNLEISYFFRFIIEIIIFYEKTLKICWLNSASHHWQKYICLPLVSKKMIIFLVTEQPYWSEKKLHLCDSYIIDIQYTCFGMLSKTITSKSKQWML